MTFKDTTLKDDIKNIFFNKDEFAEDLQYTPSGGIAQTVTVILDRLNTVQNDSADRENETKTIRLKIPTDITIGIAVPAHGDSIVLDSITYKLNEVVEMDAETNLVEFVHIKPTQRHGQNSKFQR